MKRCMLAALTAALMLTAAGARAEIFVSSNDGKQIRPDDTTFPDPASKQEATPLSLKRYTNPPSSSSDGRVGTGMFFAAVHAVASDGSIPEAAGFVSCFTAINCAG